MSPIKVKLFMASNSPHIHQPITGFLLLREKGLVKVSYVNKLPGDLKLDLPHEHCLVAFIADKIIVFDMADGYNFKHGFDFPVLLGKVDFYFKRSFSATANSRLLGDSPCINKVFPYGFNYYVAHPLISVSGANRIKKTVKYIYKHRIVHADATVNWESDSFVCEPTNEATPPGIIFCTRLWSKSKYSEADLEYINSTRIELVRRLQDAYGDHFIGGIQKDEYSQTVCPDILLPDSVSDKKEYIRLMQGSDICIGSMGLHQSIGWKTGEYVAASKAIVNERFAYEVPGNFVEGVNYYAYSTVEECLQAVDYLYNNPQAVHDMKLANRDYFNNYGRPEKLIENALAKI